MTTELKAGRYAIEEEIGRGGMGVVYRARDTRLGKTVALKMLPPELVGDADRRRRLEQEARAASRLDHPAVATVFDYVEHGGEAFIVYEYVAGTTLRDRLSTRRIEIEDLLEVGIQLADALTAAGDRGVVHRDLKPENIMLVPGTLGPPRVKILDFGLAKLREPLSEADLSKAPTAGVGTAPGLLVGTVNYMAPEQLEGEPVDHRTDLYALGLVLYEMATGVNPFLGKSATSTIANILKQAPPPVTERNPVAPAELDRILRKCLRKPREERYQSARELLVDLSNLRRDLGAPQQEAAAAPAAEVAHGFLARGVARALLLLIQASYLAMYAVLVFQFGEAGDLLQKPVFGSSLAINLWWFLFLFLTALAGTPVRLYLFTAVAMDFPDLGRKYRRLFPPALVMDLYWATAPLLLVTRLGAFVLIAVAALLYLPFSQRWLIYDAYSPHGGRSSSISATPTR